MTAEHNFKTSAWHLRKKGPMTAGTLGFNLALFLFFLSCVQVFVFPTVPAGVNICPCVNADGRVHLSSSGISTESCYILICTTYDLDLHVGIRYRGGDVGFLQRPSKRNAREARCE